MGIINPPLVDTIAGSHFETNVTQSDITVDIVPVGLPGYYFLRGAIRCVHVDAGTNVAVGKLTYNKVIPVVISTGNLNLNNLANINPIAPQIIWHDGTTAITWESKVSPNANLDSAEFWVVVARVNPQG